MTQAIDDAYSAAGLAAAPQAKRNDQLGQEDFLKLMTAQLANQDPFKPMESGDFMGQIAQFGAVQGIQDLQKSFDAFAGSMVSNQSLQSAALVGRTVLAPADAGLLTEDGLSGAVGLPYRASEVSVNIYNSAGELVKRINLGDKDAGLVDYKWDGSTDSGEPAAPGVYEIEVEAMIDGENVRVGHFAEAQVDSVVFGRVGEEPRVNLAGLGSIPFSQLHQIR